MFVVVEYSVMHKLKLEYLDMSRDDLVRQGIEELVDVGDSTYYYEAVTETVLSSHRCVDAAYKALARRGDLIKDLNDGKTYGDAHDPQAPWYVPLPEGD